MELTKEKTLLDVDILCAVVASIGEGVYCKSCALIHALKFNTLDLSLPCRLTLAEYHEQEEIFKLRLGHLKKVRTAEKAFG